jgi:hypothetical protein
LQGAGLKARPALDTLFLVDDLNTLCVGADGIYGAAANAGIAGTFALFWQNIVSNQALAHQRQALTQQNVLLIFFSKIL